MKITIYTDGGCSCNPGPGGWAFVVSAEDSSYVERSGGVSETTNNRMEMLAVISALKFLPSLGYENMSSEVTIVTDSEYVRRGMSEWIHNWKRNGWRTSDKKPVKNEELWRELDSLASPWRITWKWVRGHAGNKLNERCDSLVKTQISALTSNEDCNEDY